MHSFDDDLPKTHPDFGYWEPNTGVLRFGRPIRSNFYVYKFTLADAKELVAKLEAEGWEPSGHGRLPSDEVMAWVEKNKQPWSQQMNRAGYEINPTNRRNL